GAADAHLLLRDVRAPGLLGGGQHGSRHPHHRRGAVGGRRPLPAQVVREDARVVRSGPHDPPGLPRPRQHPPALRPGDLDAQGRAARVGRARRGDQELHEVHGRRRGRGHPRGRV
ncbi:MAG: Teichoic acid export ATP-binding protein TagH, partial [uncultured Solirubrobacteraceae bacterium]